MARAGLIIAEPGTRAETEAHVSGSYQKTYMEDLRSHARTSRTSQSTQEICKTQHTLCKPRRSEPTSAHCERRSARYCILYEGFFQLYLTACTLTCVLYWSDAGATEPLNDAGDDDEEADSCDATDGDGVVTEVLAPEPVPKARAGVLTTTRRSARLRRPVVAKSTTMVLNSFLLGC
ncbi:Hypothetical predicted protein [Olea europaea subsp. europaea]|uniref:Uncharacterized protein n=1 Tax=Olea europaea subsp. europaea TaxID=158383 RepID=A0A8S0TXE4_OLEEU|nr:Hypothetical predicted protein [Olea europaea subsp. europaea]